MSYLYNHDTTIENAARNDGCSDVEGFLEFGEYMPKHLVGQQAYVGAGAKKEGLIGWLRADNDIRNWDEPQEAMNVCLNGKQQCC